MKLLQNLRDGSLFAVYLAFLLALIVIGANGLAMLLG